MSLMQRVRMVPRARGAAAVRQPARRLVMGAALLIAFLLGVPAASLAQTTRPAATPTLTPRKMAATRTSAPRKVAATRTSAPRKVAATRTSAPRKVAATRTPSPQPTPTAVVVPADTPGALYYTVRRGDTLWLIARRFGVTVDLVSRTNGFNGKKVLREGLKLYLPYSNEAGSVQIKNGVPVVKGAGLHFVSSIKAQACWLFRDGKLANRWTCSTGRPGSPSIPGNYTVRTKMPRAYNAAADFWMPSWLGIYEAGQWENGIHGIPYRATNGERLWTDLVGTPITYGCVMLEDKIAAEVYRIAYIGMPVTILP